MAHLDPTHMATVVVPSLLSYTLSPDLVKRHGSIIGVAEVVAALSSLGKTSELTAEVAAAVVVAAAAAAEAASQ